METQPYNFAEWTIAQLAVLINDDWRKQGKGVYFGAKPYLQAMYSLQSVNDNYGMDSGKSIVNYFLANAQTWKGETAKAIKKELNKRVK